MTENGTGSNGSGSTDGPAGTPGPEGHRLPGLMDWYDTLPEKAQRVVANVILERGALISALTDQRRNLNQDCGYPEGYVQAQTYQELYDREPIPARVVEVVPLESWQVQPTVYEDEDPGTETEFEKAWDGLGKSLSAATGYYRAEMGSVVWEYLSRADVLSGVGQYGVILLGLDDGKDLSEPAEFVGPPPPWMQDSAPDATPERDRPGGPGPTGGPDVPPPGVLPAGTADIGTGMGRPSGGQPLGYPVRNVLGEGYTQALSILERGLQTDRGVGESVANAFCATGQGGGIDPSCSPGGGKAGAPQDLQKVKKALRKSDRLMAEAQQLGFEAAGKYSQVASAIPAVHSDLHAAVQVARMHSLTEGYTAAQKYAVKALHLAVKAGITGGPTFTSINTALGALYKAKVAAQEAHRLRRVAYKVRRKATEGNTIANVRRPVHNATPRKPTRRLLFLRVFPETMATIASYDVNPASPRFGQPVEYVLTFLTPTAQGGGGMATLTTPVHWTRCIHVADNLGSSEVFGTPRQQQVLNRLLDLRKLYGGSAEMYWRGAFPGYSIETLPQLGTNVEIDEKGLRDQMYRWANGLQRYVQFTGMSMKGLSPQVVDPTGQINTQLEAICVKIGVPKRKFLGSERGELSSTQDEDDWNDKVNQRQNLYVTPRIIVPFVDRLIALGVLPPPAEGYLVEWPGLSGKSESQQATIGGQRTTALVAYAGQPAAPALMAPMDFFTRIMGFTEDEAQTIVDNAEEEKKRIQAEEDAKAKQQARVQADALAKAQAQQAKQAAVQGAQQGNGQPPGGPLGQADGGPPTGGGNGQGPGGQPASSTGSTGNVAGNAFCATGPGGGVDPSCSPGGGGAVMRTGSPTEDLRANFPTDPRSARRVLYAQPAADEPGRDWRDEPGHPVHDHFHVLAALPQGGHLLLPKDGADEKGGLKALRRKEGPGLFVQRPVGREGYSAELFQAVKAPETTYHTRDYGVVRAKPLNGRFSMGATETGYELLPTEKLRRQHERHLRAQARGPAANAFCATGPGGGVDPSCSPGGGGAGAAGETGSHLDRPIGGRGNSFREFYTRLHRATEERPDAPAFHDPLRRRVDDKLLDLAGPEGGRLFYTHASGAFTVVVSRTHYAIVGSDPNGRNIYLSSSDTAVRGPSPRESQYVPLHEGMSDHELNYRLSRALGVKVPREDRQHYDAADKVARAQGRERLVREKSERVAAKEARRAERAAGRAARDDYWIKGPPAANYNPDQPRHPAGTAGGGRFAPAGGAGVVAGPTPTVRPQATRLKRAGATKEERAEIGRLGRERTRLGARIKEGTATTEDVRRRKEVVDEIAARKKAVKERVAKEASGSKTTDTSGNVTVEGGTKDQGIGHVDHASEAVVLHGHVQGLEAKSGGLVHLSELRIRMHHLSKEDFDKTLQESRRQGLVTLSGAEGRHGLREIDRLAGIHEEDPLTGRKDRLLLYASSRGAGTGTAGGAGKTGSTTAGPAGPSGFLRNRDFLNSATVKSHDEANRLGDEALNASARAANTNMHRLAALAHREAHQAHAYAASSIENDLSSLSGPAEVKGSNSEAVRTHRALAAHHQAEAEGHEAKANSMAQANPGRQATPLTIKEVQNHMGDSAFDSVKIPKIMQLMETHHGESGLVIEHGMSKLEEMDHLEIGGIKFHYPRTDQGRQAAAGTIASVVSQAHTIPALLWQAQTDVIHSSGRNSGDDYWAVQYKESGFRSNATGGDGKTVVYGIETGGRSRSGELMQEGPRSIPVSSFAHEAGHNFATKAFGQLDPPAWSAYHAAQQKEQPVSDYAKNSPSEDFAEAAMMYTVMPKTLESKFPLKHKAFHDLMEAHGGGVAASRA